MLVIASVMANCLICDSELDVPLINFKDENKVDFMFHKDCMKCSTCNKYLGDIKWCFMHKGNPYCDITCLRGKIPKEGRCSSCLESLQGDSKLIYVQRKVYHTECLKCAQCDIVLKPGVSYTLENNKIVCMKHAGNKSKKPFTRTTLTPQQRLRLLKHYKKCKYPNAKAREEIAKALELEEQVVKHWFQNTRARTKKDIDPDKESCDS